MARVILFLVAIATFCCVCQATNVTLGKSSTTRFGNMNNYYHYTRTNPRVPERVYATAASATGLRSIRPKTVVIVHDHGGSFTTSLNPTIKDALLTAEDVSVIVVDWSMVAAMQYSVAIGSVPEVGAGIADMLRFLVNARRLTLDNLHLIGFGLGAHVVAFTARALTGNVARITALDPTADQWDTNTERLRMSDANYVEVIHTDSSGTGIADAIGVVDFYPNGGITQPGCSVNNQCNHDRAWLLFAATLQEPMDGNTCNEGSSPSEANCKGYTIAMGNNLMDKFGSGRLFIQTGDKYPYQNELNCVVSCLN